MRIRKGWAKTARGWRKVRRRNALHKHGPERTRRGDVRPWVLSLGGVQRHGGFTLKNEHGAYVVRGFDNAGRHRVESFRTLTQARRALKTFGAGIGLGVRPNPSRDLSGHQLDRIRDVPWHSLASPRARRAVTVYRREAGKRGEGFSDRNYRLAGALLTSAIDDELRARATYGRGWRAMWHAARSKARHAKRHK